MVALRQAPQGEWSGMDAGAYFGGTGAAQCFAGLFDGNGLVGRSSHTLFVEPR